MGEEPSRVPACGFGCGMEKRCTAAMKIRLYIALFPRHGSIRSSTSEFKSRKPYQEVIRGGGREARKRKAKCPTPCSLTGSQGVPDSLPPIQPSQNIIELQQPIIISICGVGLAPHAGPRAGLALGLPFRAPGSSPTPDAYPARRRVLTHHPAPCIRGPCTRPWSTSPPARWCGAP